MVAVEVEVEVVEVAEVSNEGEYTRSPVGAWWRNTSGTLRW